MNYLLPLFDTYSRILIFDTETTGLDFEKDQIIQFSSVTLERVGENVEITGKYDTLIALEPGQRVPEEIERLTGITTEAVMTQGIPREQASRDIAALIESNTLLTAYNAHFDLSFLFHMLFRHGQAEALKGKDKLDLLTVYRDRRDYPHKLFHAIEAYGLTDKVQNSHRADEDTLATVYVMNAMAQEKDDLMRYINLFGYIPKYGPPPRRIRSVTYVPQPYHAGRAVYEA